ncbi:MAG: aldo/keto reductase [Steroidobacteraceae bacterium]
MAATVGSAGAAGGAEPAHESGALITRRIPSSGEAIPVIGLGTSGPFEVGAGAAARAPLRAVVDAFFEGGGRLIDTSPMYSTAERVLGELLSPEQQQRCFMATKVWADGTQAGISQMNESARLLKHAPLDLAQVHNLRDLDTQLATLRAWKAEGKVRYIGVTHYTVSAHADLERVIDRHRPDFVQINYSAVTRDAERRLLPLAAERGVAVIVNRAFEDGKLFTRLKGVPLPAWAADFDATSWAQVLLKFVIAHPTVTCVIPATGKVRNLRDNLAGGRGRLPDATALKKIAAAIAG